MQVGAFSLLFQNVSVNPGGILKILSLDCFAFFLCATCAKPLPVIVKMASFVYKSFLSESVVN